MFRAPEKALNSGDSRVCIWILERRLQESYGRREYRKINAVSKNKNKNINIIITDADETRQQIREKFAGDRELNAS